MVNVPKGKKGKYAVYGFFLIALVVGAGLTLTVVAFIPDSSIPTLSLVRDVGGGGVAVHNQKVGGTVGFTIEKALQKVGGTGFTSGGRGHMLELVDPSISNGEPITVNGLVVAEQINGVGVPVLVTQDSYYLLQTSQSIPPKAYVTVTGSLFVYSVSPYDTATDCSPFDCSYLVLQIQVSQFSVLYQGT